jgi:hypothetical protein
MLHFAGSVAHFCIIHTVLMQTTSVIFTAPDGLISEISGSHSDEYEGILAVNYFLGNLTNKMNRCRKLV